MKQAFHRVGEIFIIIFFTKILLFRRSCLYLGKLKSQFDSFGGEKLILLGGEKEWGPRDYEASNNSFEILIPKSVFV